MRKASFAELNAFVSVAERSSFAVAAKQLGVSRSALSETIRTLEDKLGVRLLNRTTRSVAVTEAGERLLAELRPALAGVDAALDTVNGFRDKPAGHLRLTVPRPAAKVIIEPILADFLKTYPSVTLEIVIDSALTDIVKGRFDAGIRPGHRLEQDMLAVRVGEDARPTVVASPEYLERNGRPKKPSDLHSHNCIRRRFASGALSPWIFERRGRSIEVAVEGSLIVGDGDLALRAALDGVGIARLPISSVERDISAGTLIPLLQDWAPPSVGFFLYYPSRRQTPAALKAFIEFLREQVRKNARDQSDVAARGSRTRPSSSGSSNALA
jgi:DNA-binding transcriptional LysR family regulator